LEKTLSNDPKRQKIKFLFGISSKDACIPAILKSRGGTQLGAGEAMAPLFFCLLIYYQGS